MSAFPGVRRAVAGALGASVLVVAFTAQAPAQSFHCFGDGDLVTFEGTASPGERGSTWRLNLARPACIDRREISSLRIIGTPPPFGIPLELTGKLLLGRAARDMSMFVALSVIRGRKVRAAGSVPPPEPASRRIAPLPPLRTAEAQCDSPPYGGTQTDYQAFVRRFGRIIKPSKILAGICNAKFGNAPRDGLHKLGFSDAKIETESTEHLAAETIAALKTLVNTIE